MNKLKKYIYKTLILTGILIGINFILFYFLLQQYYLPIFPFVILFFAVISSSVHAIMLKYAKQKISRFANSFMLSTMAKMIIYLSFVTIYLLTDKQNAVIFVVFFLINYFIYSSYEVISLLTDLKNEKK